MAKHSSGKGGNAHFRLVVFEGSVPEGELGQFAQAVQNALRPMGSVQQRAVVAPQVTYQADVQPQADSPDVSVAPEEGADGPAPAKPPRDTKPRRFPTPKLLDMTTEQAASWVSFASAKVPKNDSDRYVLAVAWYQNNGAGDGVTADHVFTCFRQKKWSVAIEDFGALLRMLKASNHLKSPGRGKFLVTQVGLQRIDDMDAAASDA